MLNNREIGDIGERMARNHLVLEDYKILESNWRFKRAEIDLIARKDDIIIFIEVKTRSYTYFGQPEEAISPKKEALIMDAAQRYMEKIGHNWAIRFDIISVLLDKSGELIKLEHFEDAFF